MAVSSRPVQEYPSELVLTGLLGLCCSRLPLISPSGKGGGGEGFGIGGANDGGLVKPSELICGDTTTEPDLGVGGILLEDELDAGVFKSTSGGLLAAGVGGEANDAGVPGRSLDSSVFTSTSGDLLAASVGGG